MYRYRSESNKTMANAKLTCDRNYPHPFLQMHAPPCDPMKKPCLFNVQWDPCEFHNLASFMPNTLKVLRDRLNFYHRIVKMPVYPSFDDKADPENNGGVWGPWKDATNKTQTGNATTQGNNFTSNKPLAGGNTTVGNETLAGNSTSPKNTSSLFIQNNTPVKSEDYPNVLVPASANASTTPTPIPHSTLQQGFGDNKDNTSTTTEAPQLRQVNYTTVYPDSLYPNASILIGGTGNASESATTTPVPSSSGNTTDGNNNTTGGLAGYLVGHGKEITVSKNGEFGAETNTSDTYGSLSEKTKAAIDTISGQLKGDNFHVGIDAKNIEVNKNQSKEAITIGKNEDWIKGIDMNTSTSHKENSFIITGQLTEPSDNNTSSTQSSNQIGAQPSTNISTQTTLQPPVLDMPTMVANDNSSLVEGKDTLASPYEEANATGSIKVNGKDYKNGDALLDSTAIAGGRFRNHRVKVLAGDQTSEVTDGDIATTLGPGPSPTVTTTSPTRTTTTTKATTVSGKTTTTATTVSRKTTATTAATVTTATTVSGQATVTSTTISGHTTTTTATTTTVSPNDKTTTTTMSPSTTTTTVSPSPSPSSTLHHQPTTPKSPPPIRVTEAGVAPKLALLSKQKKSTTTTTAPTTIKEKPTASKNKPKTSKIKPTTSKTKPTTNNTKPTTPKTKPTTSKIKATTTKNEPKPTKTTTTVRVTQKKYRDEHGHLTPPPKAKYDSSLDKKEALHTTPSTFMVSPPLQKALQIPPLLSRQNYLTPVDTLPKKQFLNGDLLSFSSGNPQPNMSHTNINGGPGQLQTNQTTTATANQSLASSAPTINNTTNMSGQFVPSRLEQEGAAQRGDGNKSKAVGTESGSESTSESEATGGAFMNKLDSKSTGIKDAYYNANLNTTADAGSNGAKVIISKYLPRIFVLYIFCILLITYPAKHLLHLAFLEYLPRTASFQLYI